LASKKCSSVLVPIITNIVNLSLSSGQFHLVLKQSTISSQEIFAWQRSAIKLLSHL